MALERAARSDSRLAGDLRDAVAELRRLRALVAARPASHSGSTGVERRIARSEHARGAGLQRARLLEVVRAGEPGRKWTPRELAEAMGRGCSLRTAGERARELVNEGSLADAGRPGAPAFVLAEVTDGR